jgi:hypothetical protein
MSIIPTLERLRQEDHKKVKQKTKEKKIHAGLLRYNVYV